jgi:DNA polymerase I-like protein with 3'-5' exonuclease and polymerase domains
MRAQDVPNFVIIYVKHTSKDIDKYLDDWISSSSVSLNFKLEQQINNPIGGKIKKISRPKRRKKTRKLPEEVSPEDNNATDSDNDPSTQECSQEGLSLRLDIDQKKHIITKMYTCFGDDPTVYIVDSNQTLRQIRDRLANSIRNFNSSSTSSRSSFRRPIKLYTQNIVLTYKVLYAAFDIDQISLDKSFEWNAFDVAWWMIQNCPNRGVNNKNSSLSLVAKTEWGKKYHHFLHPSSPKKRGKKSALVPPLTGHELGRNVEDFNRLKDVVKSGKTAILQPLIEELLVELRKRDQFYSYQSVEIPSRLTMAQMMIHGIGIDMKVMRDELSLYEDLYQQLTNIAQKYYAKSSISLTNIRDVARVLYEDLDLKKHLMNYNTISNIAKDPTNAEILAILSKYHPFPGLVRDFRKVGKALDALQSVTTYSRFSEDLKMMRVFGQCDFWQTTGRVSMYDPDLFLINRNFVVKIPPHANREEETIECAPRRCFIPVPGWIFVAADYSQLELRLLAHFSEDENLLEILNRSLGSDRTFDVFKTMAARIYQKSPDQITKENRQHAKQICYGIIYGMGNRALAGQLGVDVERAEEFRQDFFIAFPRIQEFTSKLIEDCERDGYVKSLLGRRRTITGINSKHSSEKSRANRVAINTRIQSSASDIIKIAMKAVHQRILDDYADSVRLTLEMHDELIYEVNPEILNDFATVLKSTMENVASSEELKVKLLVNLKKGPNWSNFEDFNNHTS